MGVICLLSLEIIRLKDKVLKRRKTGKQCVVVWIKMAPRDSEFESLVARSGTI